MRRAGIEALAQLGTPEAVDDLLFLLDQEEFGSAADHEAILDAIGNLSSAEEIDTYCTPRSL